MTAVRYQSSVAAHMEPGLYVAGDRATTWATRSGPNLT